MKACDITKLTAELKRSGNVGKRYSNKIHRFVGVATGSTYIILFQFQLGHKT